MGIHAIFYIPFLVLRDKHVDYVETCEMKPTKSLQKHKVMF